MSEGIKLANVTVETNGGEYLEKVSFVVNNTHADLFPDEADKLIEVLKYHIETARKRQSLWKRGDIDNA